MHATVKLDEDGDPMRDSKDRVVYRTRKHDIEEFEAVVRRHGCYKRDLESFAKAILAKPPQPGLFDSSETSRELANNPSIQRAIESLIPAEGSGIDSVTFSSPGREPVTLHAQPRGRLGRHRNGKRRGRRADA